MHLIENGTQIPTLAAPVAAVGTPGYAYNGLPGSGVETIFDPDMGNTIIAEIANVILSRLALDRLDNGQLLKVISMIRGGRLWPFTVTQAWVVPDNVYVLDVQVWGGGAGSFASAGSLCSGGGAAGGYARSKLEVQPGEACYITIGAGGNAGLVGFTTPPSAGAATIFASDSGWSVYAGGGQLNHLSTPGVNQDYGGAPGGNGEGTIGISGSAGMSGTANWPGMGGAPAIGSTIGAGTYGLAGVFPGGGAAGAGFLAGAAQPGARGGDGFCIVEF